MSCKSRKRKHHSGTILIRFCRLLKCNLNYKAPKTNKPLGMYLTPKHIMYLATKEGIENIISFFQLNRAIWPYSIPIATLNISKKNYPSRWKNLPFVQRSSRSYWNLQKYLLFSKKENNKNATTRMQQLYTSFFPVQRKQTYWQTHSSAIIPFPS